MLLFDLEAASGGDFVGLIFCTAAEAAKMPLEVGVSGYPFGRGDIVA